MNDEPLPNSLRQVIVFFQVHQPRRLRSFVTAPAGEKSVYFDDQLNESIMKRVTRECYEPANAMLVELTTADPEIRVNFSISGEALDQMEKYTPSVLETFKTLTKTGAVEMLAQPNYHSLCGLLSSEELHEQIVVHMEKVRQHFDVSPTVFCNSELIYNDDIGSVVGHMGFKGIICDGAERIISAAQRDRLHSHPNYPVKILLRNDTISDRIASRFGAGESKLTVDNVLTTIDSLPPDSNLVILGLDYELLGEQFNKEAGIINFIHDLLIAFSKEARFKLRTASEVVIVESETNSLSVPDTISWSANAKDISSWLGNDMQMEAFEMLAAQQERIATLEDDALVDVWRSLQTTDHFFYMASHKLGEDTHRSYFSQYPSPYEAFINYMQILKDFSSNLEGARLKDIENDHAKLLESERQHPKVPVWAMKKELQTRLASETKP